MTDVRREGNMPRVPNVKREDLSAQDQKIYDEISGSRKGLGKAFGALLNSPGAAQRIGALGSYVRFEMEFSPATRELVIITVSQVLNSQYEWFRHEPLAVQAGADRAIIEGIRKGKLPEGQSEQAIAVRFTHELVKDRIIKDRTFKAALDTFGVKRLIDLVALAGHYVLMAHVISALGIDPE